MRINVTSVYVDDQDKEICGAYYVSVHWLDRVP